MTLAPASSVRGGYPLGLAGATAATRYVGATASGAPASGTFALGDFAIDQTGKVFVCTAAGSPGTWAEIGGSSGGLTVVETQAAGAGGLATFDFQAIPGTGQGLMIVLVAAGEVAAAFAGINLRFNNDSGANYDVERLDGQNTTVVGGATVTGTEALCGGMPAANIAPRSSALTIMIPGYATTTLDKAFTSVGGYSLSTAQADQGVRTIHGLWRNTAAISRVTLIPSSGDFAQGSTATLYKLG